MVEPGFGDTQCAALELAEDRQLHVLDAEREPEPPGLLHQELDERGLIRPAGRRLTASAAARDAILVRAISLWQC